MPETIKPEDQDEDQGHESSDMPLAYPEIAHAAEGEAASAEPPDRSDAAGAAVSGDSLIEPEAYAFEHTATEEAPLLATEEEPEDFAASVVSGLEQLEIEEREAFELAEEAPTAGQASEDAFFTGWDGLDIPEEELSEGYQSALMPDHDPALRTLSEISLASASLLSGFSAAPAPEAGKHDELADAVQ